MANSPHRNYITDALANENPLILRLKAEYLNLTGGREITSKTPLCAAKDLLETSIIIIMSEEKKNSLFISFLFLSPVSPRGLNNGETVWGE